MEGKILELNQSAGVFQERTTDGRFGAKAERPDNPIKVIRQEEPRAPDPQPVRAERGDGADPDPGIAVPKSAAHLVKEAR